MSNTTLLTPIGYAHRDILRRMGPIERMHSTPKYGVESISLVTVEQAEAYANARIQGMLHEESKPDNIKRAELYGEGYADGWKAGLEQARSILTSMYTEAVKARVPDSDDEDGWNAGCLERALGLTDAALRIKRLLPDEAMAGEQELD